MADLSRQTVDNNGLDLTLSAASTAGDAVLNSSGRLVLVLENTSTAAYTATVVSHATADGLAIADAIIAIASTTTIYAGPFPPAVFNDGADKITVTYEGTDPFGDLNVGAMVIP